ncbi:hypothetical protein BJF82_03060 [Kytococcus sp. CUA-901]|nr:hypothetical protein BJF82_03060 [Kytococcus sp. CUA-901]
MPTASAPAHGGPWSTTTVARSRASIVSHPPVAPEASKWCRAPRRRSRRAPHISRTWAGSETSTTASSSRRRAINRSRAAWSSPDSRSARRWLRGDCGEASAHK